MLQAAQDHARGRALIVMAGWRIPEILALKRDGPERPGRAASVQTDYEYSQSVVDLQSSAIVLQLASLLSSGADWNAVQWPRSRFRRA